MLTELKPIYSGQKSFGHKANVEIIGSDSVLYSYDTKVAEIKNNKANVHGTYSNTTLKHIKEYLLQNGYRAKNKKQIVRDYMK
jgi:hypothetical protein